MIGKLISISGLDGAGKSTQIALLEENLKIKNLHCVTIQFDAVHYGAKAKEIISELSKNDFVFTRLCINWEERFPLIKDFVYDDGLQTPELALAVTSVFAGGCIQVYEECIKPLLLQGVHVVCDRFWLDDIVFRSFWVEEEMIRRLYSKIPRPDLAIYLKVNPEIIKKRNESRIDGKSPLLRKIESIDQICEKFDILANQESMVVIHGKNSPDIVGNEILNYVLGILKQ